MDEREDNIYFFTKRVDKLLRKVYSIPMLFFFQDMRPYKASLQKLLLSDREEHPFVGCDFSSESDLKNSIETLQSKFHNFDYTNIEDLLSDLTSDHRTTINLHIEKLPDRQYAPWVYRVLSLSKKAFLRYETMLALTLTVLIAPTWYFIEKACTCGIVKVVE